MASFLVMKTIVHLRTFCHPSTRNEHSYYVDYEEEGLSQRLSTITVDSNSTIAQMREQIQEYEENGVKKRSSFYTEFLQFMQRIQNPGYEDSEPSPSYQIGVLRNKDGQCNISTISIIQRELECEPICEVVRELLGTDFVLIPSTQIHPETRQLSIEL